jgi:AhpD family alkylhydroperoxidase
MVLRPISRRSRPKQMTNDYLETFMTARIALNPSRHREVLGAMINLGATVRRSELEHPLIALIKVRVSQINGCGYCIDMHTKDARAEGETEQRLYMLNAWWETSLYSERERAALKWAEAVTRLEHQEVPDEIYENLSRVFTEDEIVALTLCVVEINAWNRFAISFKYEAGNYQPGSVRTLRETVAG